MEDNSNRIYVNISNRPFSSAVYNDEDSECFSYKPTSGYWLSLESTEKGYYSEWDEEYREILETDDNGNLYATKVKLKPTTYTISPSRDKNLLEGFYQFVSNKQLTAKQKRRLLVELVRTRTGREDVENVICQIDLVEDLTVLEEIFAGYKLGNSYPEEFYKTLAKNVKKGIRESFSGLEVTAYALGMDKNLPSESISDTQIYWSSVDPNYDESIDLFDMPSAVIFDTSCLDIIEEVVYPQEMKIKKGDAR